MDFWSRLIANTRLSSGSSSKDAARDPIRRRQRFEKEYGQLLHIWRNCSNLARDEDAAENIEIRLQGLTNILSDESRRPLPHPCISFCSTKQIYVPIAKIATTSYNEWIIKEAVLFYATLIESEEEAFVESEAFSASLTNLLVRITGANSIRLGPDTEVKVVELAFNITTKIRLEPHILSTWFKSHPESHGGEEKTKDQREKFAGRTQKQDFPLFYLLMDYIHHEGKIGDFARTGLLYIIEAASSSVALEQWIVESDLSTLMATGLGALYSQLSRKLVIDHPPENLPPILALSDYQHPTSTFEIVSSCSPDFQLHLETFLSHMLFWQDVLNHCRSVEVKSTLLEHFQVIFLQQLLYPSLLESSDVDGGSSVAVLTYLRRILETLDHPDMINLILHYLLALPDTQSSALSEAEPSVSAARKRKSMDLATMMATKVETSYTPLLFNLVDLIRSCVKSRNQQTVCVTLQLVAAILKRHHRYATTTLLRTEGIDMNTSRRTAGAHQQEVEFLTTLAGTVGGQDNFDEMYENILKDSMTRVEGHPCSLKLVAPKLSTNNHKLPAIPDSLPGAPRDVPPHTLSVDDPLLNSILDIFETFFINPVEMNLSATETIIDLSVCGYISVEGWFLRHPKKYSYDDPDEPLSPPPDPESPLFAEFERLAAIMKCRRRPAWKASSLPRMLTVLESLADQVDYFRSSVPRFDELLQQRREAFQTADAVVINPQPHRPSSVTTDQASQDGSRAESPARPSALEGFAQRILSELGTPSRSNSPRGRKDSLRGSSTGSGTSAGYGFTSPTSKPAPAPPKEFPMNYESPSKSGLSRSFSPGSHHSDRDSPVVSQAAAFAAVDQGILARQITLPTPKIEPIPLDFGQKKAKNPTNIGEDQSNDSEGKVEVTEEPDHDESEIADQSIVPTPPETPVEVKTASVSHVLTNVIVYQQFLLELASLIQVRAGLFNEVKFA
ncbi:Retinoic acid induced 16-like protein-domain-containing protein [Annulohypoxylon truncatum]|uniref:Retinoic acid induced 16-like protein-domain-containing protein n=1 Tax=Annulohypoxylon truncatum TaxID=327061 RepID=UPI002007BCEF|nr:Retinoic acid induced 16-like protein-domain-containing protein [Annulohypoxylon truncatum]KAI1215186.1 Retinoic acid induced 16-like protein-domain-containing protein [Annulohypoxylon truncatum]